jgi:hypothetical protein
MRWLSLSSRSAQHKCEQNADGHEDDRPHDPLLAGAPPFPFPQRAPTRRARDRFRARYPCHAFSTARAVHCILHFLLAVSSRSLTLCPASHPPFTRRPRDGPSPDRPDPVPHFGNTVAFERRCVPARFVRGGGVNPPPLVVRSASALLGAPRLRTAAGTRRSARLAIWAPRRSRCVTVLPKRGTKRSRSLSHHAVPGIQEPPSPCCRRRSHGRTRDPELALS